MTAISRNGVSGLALRLAAIAFAALMFGCAPKAEPSAGIQAAQAIQLTP